jgi:hypothetical protein
MNLLKECKKPIIGQYQMTEGEDAIFNCSDIATEEQTVEFSRNRTIYEKSRLENNKSINVVIEHNVLTIKNTSNSKVII